MSKKILENENYMNDVVACNISNIVQAIKRKKNAFFWGPIDIPVDGKREFTIHEPRPTMTFKSELVNKNHVDSQSSAKEKVNPHYYLEKDSLKTAKQRYVSNLKNLEEGRRKILNETNNISDEDDKKIPTTYATYQQYNHDTDTTSGAQTVENINVSSVSHTDRCQKMDSSLSGDLLSNSRLFSDVYLEDEENSINVKEPLIENINFNDVELVAVSSEVENVSSVNSNKRLGYDTDAKADVRNKFDSWCEKRRKECKSRSTLNQSDVVTPIIMTTEIQKDSSNSKATISKNEPVVDFFQSLSESDPIMLRSKINLSESENGRKMEKCIKNFKEMHVTVNSDTKKDFISENNPLFSFKVSHDKQDTISSNEHHHTYTSSKAVEKILNINLDGTSCADKNLERSKLSKSSEFIIDKHGRNKDKKLHNPEKTHNSKHKHSRSYELPPRFKNLEVEKSSLNSNKQSVSKIVLSNNNSINEDSKQKICRKKKENSIHYSSDCVFSSRNDHCFSAKDKAQLCIRITDEKSEKDFEFMTDFVAISRIKKTFPELSAEIPDVDSGCKEMCYSADAMNIILRRVLCRSYKIVKPSPVTGVEVLAAAKLWNINKLFNQADFIQDVLTSKNAGLVFSHAYHYGLKEVCDACKDISPDNTVLNMIAPRKRQKMCLVSIFTYIEPLEINIPFEPTETDISLSFKKQIHNKFTFKAISGSYSIIGFHIQLNEEHVVKKVDIEDSKNMLEIDYSIKNVNDNKKFEGREEKPLRPINIIYFKKNLVINPNETGEIIIETEIEPYLCSSYKEKKVRVKNSAGDLDLMMESNMKIKNTDRKLFLIGKFFYHATEIPQNLRK